MPPGPRYRGGMSTFMRPVGPEPPMVYWLRRVGIVVVVLVVLVSLVWLVGGRGTSETAAPSPVSSDAAPSAMPSGAASGSAAPASGEPVDCPDAAIAVTADSDASSYPVGSQPKLSMTIQNIGDAACLRDVGPKANALEVTSGGFHVWSSDDCNASDKSKIVVLEPGEKVATQIAWDGSISQKGCPAGQGKAKPGSYDVTGTNGQVTSDKARFKLTKA